LKPESETKFFIADDPRQGVEFEVDVAGKVAKALVCMKGERVDELKKVE